MCAQHGKVNSWDEWTCQAWLERVRWNMESSEWFDFAQSLISILILSIISERDCELAMSNLQK